MQNTKRLSELLTVPGKRLASLTQRSAERLSVLAQVRTALPAKLADAVVSAGIEGDRLTLGARSAVWASRLRYVAAELRAALTASSGSQIKRVRVKVVPPTEP